jgi:hypothetical protein
VNLISDTQEGNNTVLEATRTLHTRGAVAASFIALSARLVRFMR